MSLSRDSLPFVLFVLQRQQRQHRWNIRPRGPGALEPGARVEEVKGDRGRGAKHEELSGCIIRKNVLETRIWGNNATLLRLEAWDTLQFEE